MQEKENWLPEKEKKCQFFGKDLLITVNQEDKGGDIPAMHLS